MILTLYDEQDLKETRWQASTVTTLEDELKWLRRVVDDRKFSGSAESTNPVREKATVAEACVEQLSADTVAAGVTFASETNEDDEPWHDPVAGHMWVRFDLSKLAESVGEPSAPQRDA